MYSTQAQSATTKCQVGPHMGEDHIMLVSLGRTMGQRSGLFFGRTRRSLGREFRREYDHAFYLKLMP
jgi:hypothetical protein